MIGTHITKVICDGVDITEDLMPDCVIDSKEKIIRVVYSEKYDRRAGNVDFSLPLICVELKPKRVVIHYSNGEGDICNWNDNPGVVWGFDIESVDNGSIEKITKELKEEFSEMIPKQKLVRPQMTSEARDILKSWDGETNSDKVQIMDLVISFTTHQLTASSELNKALLRVNGKYELAIENKTKELSTLAGYLAVSICINFVAIGWVAWTKGWLS